MPEVEIKVEPAMLPQLVVISAITESPAGGGPFIENKCLMVKDMDDLQAELEAWQASMDGYKIIKVVVTHVPRPVYNFPWNNGAVQQIKKIAKALGFERAWTAANDDSTWLVEKQNAGQIIVQKLDDLIAQLGRFVNKPEPAEKTPLVNQVSSGIAAMVIERNLSQGGHLEFASKDPLAEHRCNQVAELFMAEGRNWWLGELLEPLPDYPQETHCLHLKTPVKEVVLGVNRADMEQLAVLSHIVCGPINQDWLEVMAQVMKARVVNKEEHIGQ